MRLSQPVIVAIVLGLTAGIVIAAEPDFTELQARLEELSEKVERLEGRGASESDEVQPLPPTAVEVPVWSYAPTPPPKGPADKPTYPSVKVTGFFQADAGWFGQDALNRVTPVAGTEIGDLQDGADFRRARLAAVGDIAENASYMLEMDFGFPGRPSFMDVWVELKETFGPGTVRAGQFRHPFSMDAMTSVRELPLFERALPFAFVPFRQIGAMYYGSNEDLDITWAISGFRFPTDTFGGNIGDNGGFGLATRWTCAPFTFDHDRYLFHVGFNYSLGDPANDLVRYRNQPEFFVSETGGADQIPIGVPTNVPPFVDTGALPTQDFQLFGVELASILGPLHYQSEAIFAHVNRLDDPSNDFWGAYAQLGYYLTGEVRPYNHKAGVMGRVEPFCPVRFGSGWGAWEVVGRWSYIDLNDGLVEGNELSVLSAGLNWYLNRYLKCQGLYNYSTLDSLAVGESNVSIYALRLQMDF